MDIKDKINFKQPKYVLPAILYVLIMITGYFFIDMFNTETAEVGNKDMTTTEFLNSKLPEAKLKSNDIGSKYDSMLESYGKIDDYSAVGNIDRDNPGENKEEFSSKYSEQDLAMMEENERLKAQLEEKEKRQEKNASSQLSSVNTEKAMEELNRALAEARLQSTGTSQSSYQSVSNPETKEAKTGHIVNPDAPVSTEIDKNSKTKRTANRKEDKDSDVEVVKKVRTNSDYFHTINVTDADHNLIKAIIDEDVKASDGTRVRLRLLDDISVGDIHVPKGTYLYVTMNGFGSQRVKGDVKSILVDGEISKVSLSLYDMDGLEGLYVPGSTFRETAKDVGSGALSGNSMMSNTTGGNGLSQWGMQAVQNAYTKTSNAISKAIKKNTVKLKYGTFVYLVNSKSNKNK